MEGGDADDAQRQVGSCAFEAVPRRVTERRGERTVSGDARRYATVAASPHAMLRGIPRVSGTGVVVRVGDLELPVESIREVDWS